MKQNRDVRDIMIFHEDDSVCVFNDGACIRGQKVFDRIMSVKVFVALCTTKTSGHILQTTCQLKQMTRMSQTSNRVYLFLRPIAYHDGDALHDWRLSDMSIFNGGNLHHLI